MRFLEQSVPEVSVWTERFRPTRRKIALILIGQFYLEMDDERAVLSLVRKYEIPLPDVSSVQALSQPPWPVSSYIWRTNFEKKQKFSQI